MQEASSGGKEHWERIHETKSPSEVSWSQSQPDVSLRLIEATGVRKDGVILDVGGGISCLVDHLIGRGHECVTVLDLSSAALEHTKARLADG